MTKRDFDRIADSIGLTLRDLDQHQTGVAKVYVENQINKLTNRLMGDFTASNTGFDRDKFSTHVASVRENGL
jgi:hypothetical protein